jgi:hypothetical protein
MNLNGKIPLGFSSCYRCSFSLWSRLTLAIRQNDQISATSEKTLIEDEQRNLARERKVKGIEWHPQLFCLDAVTKEWTYIHTE